MTNRQSADIVIVGAGAYGLSCAFHIFELDPKAKVMVLDAGEFASGASGRNGAGFRMQWAREFNIRLSQESIRFFEDAVQCLDYPDGIDLKQDGYLMLAHSEASMAQLQKGYEMQ